MGAVGVTDLGVEWTSSGKPVVYATLGSEPLDPSFSDEGEGGGCNLNQGPPGSCWAARGAQDPTLATPSPELGQDPVLPP